MRPKTLVLIALLGLLVWLAGCGGGLFVVGSRPSQADIDLCKANLGPDEGPTLQILWEEFDEVVLDGVHNKDTCPILALGPIQTAHGSGADSDATFAKRLYKFYVAKYKQNLNGHAKKVDQRLAAATPPLPPLGSHDEPAVDKPCPVEVEGKPCGAPSVKKKADSEFKYFLCSKGHEWKKPKQ